MKTSCSSTNQPQLPSPKVKNILIRRCHAYRRYGIQCPENSHLLKHFPKYYKNLTLEITSQNPILSKVKKIKKLNSFARFIKRIDIIPPTHWFLLLKPHQKELRKLPEIKIDSGIVHPCDFGSPHRDQIKFFYNITSLHLSAMRLSNITSDECNSISMSISHMRQLKRLEIYLYRDNSSEVKRFLGKLDKIDRLLGQLESLKLTVGYHTGDLEDLFENKRFMSHLTSLAFDNDSDEWSPFLSNVPGTCKNLRYLSLHLADSFSGSPEFTAFLVSIKDLPKLVRVNFSCQKNIEEFLKFFKPQASLRYFELLLDFSGTDLTNFESKSISQYENLIQHWEELPQLKTLNLCLVYDSPQMMLFSRILVTMILKKVRKLKSFKCRIYAVDGLDYTSSSYLPFFIQQVPHLYDSLENFRTYIHNRGPINVNFNLGALKVFKNLKKIKIRGEKVRFAKIKETIGLLENKKFSKLNLKGITIGSKKDLKSVLGEISKAKITENNNNSKIRLDFVFNAKRKGEEMKYFNKFCRVINSAMPRKGLLISLLLIECLEPSIEKMRAVIKRYPEIRNCILTLYATMQWSEYYKIDGMEPEFKKL